MQDTAYAEARPDVAVAGASRTEHKQYLTFMLGGEMFAIGILWIKEIIEYAGLTEVPMTPQCIRGVINLRGSVVPVLDLLARFGKNPAVITKRSCIVVLEIDADGERHEMGVVVDAVSAVLEIPASDIEPAPEFGANIRTDFIHGMGKVGGKFVILLDPDKVLSIADIGAVIGVREMAHGAMTSVAAGAD